jgi:PAB-dependent poly(A)-specific ribonuclease subunit 3
MISRRLVGQVDDALGYADALERDLECEMDNGRVVRLMSKLGFINERPEYQMDPRYIFVFYCLVGARPGTGIS